MTEVSPRTETKMFALAERINAVHQVATTAARAALEHAREAGELLLEAKSNCDSDWSAWIDDHFEGPARTARNYMLLAERCCDSAMDRTQE